MTDIVKRLLALASAEHDDLAVADEAADEIERLREALKGAQGSRRKAGEVSAAMKRERLPARALRAGFKTD